LSNVGHKPDPTICTFEDCLDDVDDCNLLLFPVGSIIETSLLIACRIDSLSDLFSGDTWRVEEDIFL